MRFLLRAEGIGKSFGRNDVLGRDHVRHVPLRTEIIRRRRGRVGHPADRLIDRRQRQDRQVPVFRVARTRIARALDGPEFTHAGGLPLPAATGAVQQESCQDSRSE